ncbi:hypothetical protein [Conexibacter arvalis]|uniref:SnoaL-like domain-containing protein n=1 Tax=Conexibacter arvalis TaxID=912552 RepID=A0A840I972_9ACTN|nr:hypothetical protein [Conexibacter arvalis]MBB4660684.1 hypothetical protein [Conexibacter arvalis]
MADQVPAVGNILTLIERGDWERLTRALDPEVHWTTAAEDELHGPAAVVERLRRDPPPAPPAYHELRDGRLLRWIETPG